MPPSSPLGSPIAEVRVQARLTQDQRVALERAVATVRESQARSLDAALALSEIKEQELHAEHGSFVDFARDTFGIGRRRAYQLAQAGLVYAELRDADIIPLPKSEAQVRPLVRIGTAAGRRAAWESAVAAGGGSVQGLTMDDVEWAVKRALGELPSGDASVPVDLVVAAVERHRTGGPAPTDKIVGEHRKLLGRLAPKDQAAVWDLVAEDERAARTAEYDQDGQLSKTSAGAVRAAVIALGARLEAERLEAAHDARCESVGADDPDGLTVLLERHLLSTEPETPAGTTDVGGSVLTTYSSASDSVADLVRTLDLHNGVTTEAGLERMYILARRQLVRSRTEPQVAAWSWAVLTPRPRRSATAWFPDAGAPPPCYVPARLTQPMGTDPTDLDVRLPTARTVLLAPGVDLLRADVPAELADTVLARAAVQGGFLFLAATNSPDRIAGRAWAPNVLPSLQVDGRAAGGEGPADVADIERAVAAAADAFETAGVRGILVFDDVAEALSTNLFDRAAGHAFALVLRGGATGQAFYDQALGARSADTRVVTTSSVRCRPCDALLSVDGPTVPVVSEAMPIGATAVAVTTPLPRPNAR